MFSMPKSFTNITSSIAARIEVHTEASLIKSETIRDMQKADLHMWKEQQVDTQNERINKHLQRKQLSEAEQTAVDAWRASINK